MPYILYYQSNSGEPTRVHGSWATEYLELVDKEPTPQDIRDHTINGFTHRTTVDTDNLVEWWPSELPTEMTLIPAPW